MDPVVESAGGSVRGIIETSSENFEYFSFKGIPYAEAPVGNLRFADPVPKKNWSGVRDAKDYGPICLQHDFISNDWGESEDCLYLNVYTKSLNTSTRSAVMVWIHGGGFHCGCSNDIFYGPDYLLRKDIVLVTINYRVGIFGFLDLEDEHAPGNQGLKDQVMALRWVQENIEKFGGDSKNVTIFGESAGGASVHYLSLSPLTKGLFHKAISQSGVCFNPWAVVNNSKANAYELCAILGNPTQDSQQIVKFLKSLEAKKINVVQEQIRKSTGKFPFGPGVDSKSKNPFMPIPAEKLAERGVQIPYLLGYTSREAIIFFIGKTHEEMFDMANECFEFMLPMNAVKVLNRHNVTPEQYKRAFFKSEKISMQHLDSFLKFFGELHFIEGIHRFTKIQVEKSSSPTYCYKFSYDPGHSLVKSMSAPVKGASHFDDIRYLFKMKIYDRLGLSHIKKETPDHKMMLQMTEMWTNFAKFGKPTSEISDLTPVNWLPVSDGNVIRYLNIDEDLRMKSVLNLDKKLASISSIRC